MKLILLLTVLILPSLTLAAEPGDCLSPHFAKRGRKVKLQPRVAFRIENKTVYRTKGFLKLDDEETCGLTSFDIPGKSFEILTHSQKFDITETQAWTMRYGGFLSKTASI